MPRPKASNGDSVISRTARVTEPRIERGNVALCGTKTRSKPAGDEGGLVHEIGLPVSPSAPRATVLRRARIRVRLRSFVDAARRSPCAPRRDRLRLGVCAPQHRRRRDRAPFARRNARRPRRSCSAVRSSRRRRNLVRREARRPPHGERRALRPSADDGGASLPGFRHLGRSHVSRDGPQGSGANHGSWAVRPRRADHRSLSRRGREARHSPSRCCAGGASNRRRALRIATVRANSNNSMWQSSALRGPRCAAHATGRAETWCE